MQNREERQKRILEYTSAQNIVNLQELREYLLHRQVPPQNIEAERALLSSVMLYIKDAKLILTDLEPEDFYLERHQLIYRAILDLDAKGVSFDLFAIADLLKSRGVLDKVGGFPYLSELVEYSPSFKYVDFLVQQIKEKSMLRKLISACSEIISDAYGEIENVGEFIDRSEQKIFEIRRSQSKSELKPLQDVLQSTFFSIEQLVNRKDDITGVPTGFHEFDKMTSGLQPGDLIILAGRPSMGKTTLALNMALNAALDYKASVAFFSLEMSKEQLIMRLLCSLARIDAHRLRVGKLSGDELARLTSLAASLNDIKFYIDDSPDVSTLELRAKCRRLKMEEEKLDLIVIDYLQLMRSNRDYGGSREREIAEISRNLKILAKELDVAVIALSQLNRSLERRPDKRPMMSDLRESGSLEQDADLILFIYRDEVYNPETDDKDVAELIIAKQRNGPVGTVRLKFQKSFNRFDNFNPPDGPQNLPIPDDPPDENTDQNFPPDALPPSSAEDPDLPIEAPDETIDIEE